MIDIVGVSASTHHLGEQLERVDRGDYGCAGCFYTKSSSAQSFVRLLENNKITLYPTPLLLVKLFVIYILNHLFIKLVVSNMTARKLLRVDVIKN